MTDATDATNATDPRDPADLLDWVSETTLRVDGTDYDLMESDDGSMARLRLLKTRAMIERYLPIIEEFRGTNVIELGIFRGGSTAFFAQLLDPRRLVAVELDQQRVGILDDFIAERSMAEVVKLHYGVDQADRERVLEIVEHDLDGEPIDLVLDDASHLYGPTIVSFETLFPRLRPGGLYVIEDWRPHQDYLNMFIGAVPDRTSATTRNIETMLGVALAAGEDASRIFVDWCARTVLEPTAPGHAEVSTWYDAVCADPSSPAHAVISEQVGAQIAGSPDQPPVVTPSLTTLAAQLVLAVASGNDAVGELTVNTHWIALRRGPDPIDPATFRVGSLAIDHLGTLARHTSPASLT